MGLRDDIMDYAVILCDGLTKTKFANSRSEYEMHMATALFWLANLYKGVNEEDVKKSIRKHSRVYGWSSLRGQGGCKVEEAFYKLHDNL